MGTLAAGDRIGHFVIVSALGAGGMGEVYVAHDTRLERRVALKIVQVRDDDDSASGRASATGGGARLLREAQAAAALEHPNVVTIYEVGELPSSDGGDPITFIAMELVKGKTLRAHTGDASVPIATRVRWLTAVARALGAAHDGGLIHRDMKPENVMIREDGVVRVLDFGLAKRAAKPSSASSSTDAQVFASLTGQGVAVGTPLYMAPEQMRREPLDGGADQFSWGVVAYELLSGVSPWGKDVDALELVSKLLTGSPPPLAVIAPDVPATVAAVVTRALSKERAARFLTMHELIAALEVIAPAEPALRSSGGSAPAIAESGRGGLAKPRRTRRRAWLGYGAAIVAAIGVLAVGVRTVGDRRAPSVPVAPGKGGASLRECTGAPECVAKSGGKPAVCGAGGRCVVIETDRCTPLFEPRDLARADTVWIGAMFPRTGPGAAFGVSNLNAVDLARRDFATAGAALRSPDGGAPVHPLAVVACDDASDPDAVARHLVDDVGVPAVIGFASSAETLDLATSLLVPRGVLTLAAVSLSPLLADVPHSPDQPRLVWRTTYNNAETARAIAALIGRLESQARASHKDATVRVAVVRRSNPGATAFAEAIFGALRFNGKSALDNGPDYREFNFTGEDEEKDHARVAREVARFAPTFVVFAADSSVVPLIEDAWPSSARRPTYVSDSTFDADLVRYVGASKDRRRRLYGLTSVSTTTPNARFVLHYNETFPEPITRTWAPNSSYDAFYVIGYAAYALGEGPVTGAALARAIPRLGGPGPVIDVGPSGVLGAFGALRRGAEIDLNGATGSLDFDVRTGDAPVDLAILCPGTDPSGSASEAIESGLVFTAKEEKLVGEPRCP